MTREICLVYEIHVPFQTASWLINSFINSVSQPFPPTALQCHHAQTVRDSTFSYKINYIIVIKNFLNPEGHQNPISGSKVTAILLKGWFLHIGEASSGRVCTCSLRRRLIDIHIWFIKTFVRSFISKILYYKKSKAFC